ncbi:MAG: hypothetical protein Q9212_002631 [Teloschistes hypoglaucus]
MLDLSAYSVHVDRLLTVLLKYDGSGVDLQTYFQSLALDSSTELHFGHSTNYLSRNPTVLAQTFLQACACSKAGIMKRMQLPQWDSLTPDKRFWRDASYKGPTRLVLVHQVAEESQNREEIVNQLLNVFLPAHDATAVALTTLFFHLSHHPPVYATLHREILALGPHADWTFERPKACTYLRAVMNETLRLNPSIG